mmetsp:Transcript_24421/g.30453  ORF Transcript_24421/g.30453 Transcript_24421/m.30453 type:complete len:261 (+) Transcript_24421:1-783(+)
MNCLLCSKMGSSFSSPSPPIHPIQKPLLPHVQPKNMSLTPENFQKLSADKKQSTEAPVGIYYEDDQMLAESHFELKADSECEMPEFSNPSKGSLKKANVVRKQPRRKFVELAEFQKGGLLNDASAAKIDPSHLKSQSHPKKFEQQSPAAAGHPGNKNRGNRKGHRGQKLSQSAYANNNSVMKKLQQTERKSQKHSLQQKKRNTAQDSNNREKSGVGKQGVKSRLPQVTPKYQMEGDVQHLYLAKQAILAAASILDEDGPA